jgi:hypothetical protein
MQINNQFLIVKTQDQIADADPYDYIFFYQVINAMQSCICLSKKDKIYIHVILRVLF